ncbi:hypothetical protein [Actinomadura fibrosa]|uniref:ATP-binding protein n=1 Tax=Actinomadura fibrosa TaxID=111802 RepID=A0ABW2XUI3_9ACTN|nr:hypothetical protein [Actinomadura fibrosa]
MTRVNPFERVEDPRSPAPMLRCRHEDDFCPDDCVRHINVVGSEDAYATFREYLGDGSGLVDSGLFVTVCGPEQAGKTSLLNRCLRLAMYMLRQKNIPFRHIDLSPFGLSPGITAEERMLLARNKVLEKAANLAGIFDRTDFKQWLNNPQPGTQPGQAGWQSPENKVVQTFESTMDSIKDALSDSAVLIVVTPRAHGPVEAMNYSRGTFEKLLVFTEAGVPRASDLDLPPSSLARHCLLELTKLRDTSEVASYLDAYLNVAGRGTAFPPLFEGMRSFWGDPPDVSVGEVQALMHKIYEFYRKNPPSPGATIGREDVQQVIRTLSEG